MNTLFSLHVWGVTLHQNFTSENCPIWPEVCGQLSIITYLIVDHLIPKKFTLMFSPNSIQSSLKAFHKILRTWLRHLVMGRWKNDHPSSMWRHHWPWLVEVSTDPLLFSHSSGQYEQYPTITASGWVGKVGDPWAHSWHTTGWPGTSRTVKRVVLSALHYLTVCPSACVWRWTHSLLNFQS